MNFAKELLDKVLNKKSGFCCLCLKLFLSSEDAVYLSDDIVVNNEGNGGNMLKINQIVSCVLGEKVFEEISVFETICQQCSARTFKAYSFILECKENFQGLSDAIRALISSVEEIPENSSEYSSLFLLLDPKLLITHQYFDAEKTIKNTKQALIKFQHLMHPAPVKKESKTSPLICVVNKKPKFKECNDKNFIKVEIGLNKNECARSHAPSRVNNPKCKVCCKEFANMRRLKLHFLRVHAPKVLQCPECPKRFAAKNLLRIHQKECHVDLTCSICGKEFNHKHTLTIHEKAHKSFKLVCTDCGRVYKNKNTFREHIKKNICQTAVRNSPKNAKFTCDYCGKKYTQKMSLIVHIRVDHMNIKSYDCKDCNKKFSCQSRLKAHSIKHTKEKNFMCSICNRSYVTKESLLYHTRIHTGHCPYKCTHCDQRFLSASRRSMHVKKYHMNSTFQCDDCGTQFKTYYLMHKHKATHCMKNHEETKEENTNPQVKYYDDYFNPLEGAQKTDGTQSNIELVYQLTDAERQQIEITNEVYFEVEEDGNSYVLKVSENVEV